MGHLGFTGTSLWIDLDREAVIALLTNRVHLIAKKSRFGLRPIVHDAIIEAFEAVRVLRLLRVVVAESDELE